MSASTSIRPIRSRQTWPSSASSPCDPGPSTTTGSGSWRQTYDAAACEVAGGLSAGIAQADLAGHETFIGTCVGAVRTYHVHLADPDRVIAITALGTGRFGERVVAGLRE